MTPNGLLQRVRSAIEDIPLIDTHEHLISESTRLGQKLDLFHWLPHYTSSDLVSAGLAERTLERLRDAEIPLEVRWAEFAPAWANARTTAYGRSLLLAARDLFEIDDINAVTYQRLSEKISASNYKGWYHHVLKQRANIECAVVQSLEEFDPTPLEEVDRSLFAPVAAMNDFILLCGRADLAALALRSGVAIHSLSDLLQALDVVFERAVAAHVVGVKVSVAYARSLDFEKVAQADAERVFNQLSRYPPMLAAMPSPPPVSWAEAKPLQDYMMHHVVRRAIEHDLPIQIHTGLQEGNGNLLANSHPLHLTQLLIEYPEARFDLLHAGYPYQSQMATLAKNFPNAYVDLCWVHVISPWVARQTLHELIETVPANKIFAFGGDYIFVEGAYAHSRLARDNVAQVLTEKIEVGYLGEEEALGLAHKLLRDNARQFFRLST